MGSPGVACLKPGGTYRASGQIHLVGSMLMTLDGQGATINHPTRDNSPIFLIDNGGSQVKLRNVRVVGANPRPGKWDRAYEHNHCVHIGGTLHVELDRLTCVNVGGDGVKVEGGANRWADDIWVHDSVFDGIGRMGVALTDGASHVTVERNTWRRIGYYTFDIEPNGAQVGGRLSGAEFFKFLNNAIGPKPYGDYPADPTQADGFAFVTTGASGGGYCADGEVRNNVISDATYPKFRVGLFLSCPRVVFSGNVAP